MAQERTFTIPEIISAFAAETGEHFPQLKGRLLMLETFYEEGTPYPGIAVYKTLDQKATGISDEDIARQVRLKTQLALGSSQTDVGWAALDAEKEFYMICLNQPVEDPRHVTAAERRAVLTTLDHELAHLTLKDGMGPEEEGTPGAAAQALLAESIADAYALLRYYQRHGIDSAAEDFGCGSPLNRAVNLLLYDDTAHFTTFVTQAITEQRGDLNLKTLTPAETGELAWRLAVTHTPPLPVTAQLQEKLSSAVISLGEEGCRIDGAASFKTATDPACNPAVFKVARLLTETYLDLHVEDMPPDTQQKIRAHLKEISVAMAQKSTPQAAVTQTSRPAHRAAPRP